jgi:hypothetical protein
VGLFNFRNLRVAAAAQVQYTRGKSPEKKENTLWVFQSGRNAEIHVASRWSHQTRA